MQDNKDKLNVDMTRKQRQGKQVQAEENKNDVP